MVGRVCTGLACSHSAIAKAVTEVNWDRICAEGDALAWAISLAFERFQRDIYYKDCRIEKLFLNATDALKR